MNTIIICACKDSSGDVALKFKNEERKKFRKFVQRCVIIRFVSLSLSLEPVIAGIARKRPRRYEDEFLTIYERLLSAMRDGRLAPLLGDFDEIIKDVRSTDEPVVRPEDGK